jgi:hypothetical protein
MRTIKLHKDFLIDELDLPDSAIKNTIVDTSRWSIDYECVFAYDGKFYMANYSVGATEMQDESPWEHEEEVECTEVELVEQTIKVWKSL